MAFGSKGLIGVVHLKGLRDRAEHGQGHVLDYHTFDWDEMK